ncbi:MAG TPA: hypothetical protein VK879_23220, partial [Candidatus Sulfomarinibacteraceae bacterium]|nr:hypothetical protein [Candidatus Sulfomarinibacteraceae bacterium]
IANLQSLISNPQSLAQSQSLSLSLSRSLSLSLPFFLLGFSPYLIQFLRLLRTFPLAEVMGPAVGATFLQGSLALSPGPLAQSVISYLIFLLYQFGPPGLLLGLYGWWRGRRAHPRLWRSALALYAVYLAFGLVYRVSDQFAFFLGAHLFWAVAMALGLALLYQRLRPPAQRWLTLGLLLWLVAVPPIYSAAPHLLRAAGVDEVAFGIPQIGDGVRDGLNYYLNPNKRGDREAYHFGRDTLQQLPPDALVLAQWYVDTDEYFVFRYFIAVEGLRPDVEVVGWPTVDPFDFNSQLAVTLIEETAPHRPVYLASLSDDFYAASTLVERYCIAPQHNLYRLYPDETATGAPCLTTAAVTE